MDVTSATNERTLIAAACPHFPSGNKVPLLLQQSTTQEELCLLLDSFVFDFVMRRRLGGLSVNYFILAEAALPQRSAEVLRTLRISAQSLCGSGVRFAGRWFENQDETPSRPWRSAWGLSPAERLRLRCVADSLAAVFFRVDTQGLRAILDEYDEPDSVESRDPKGFWRVDKDKAPELRPYRSGPRCLRGS